MRAVVFERYGEPAEVREVPDPAPRAARGRGARRGHRAVPQRLARLDGPRPGHRAAARARARTRRRRRGGRRRGDAAGAPGDRVTVPFVCACGSCAACAAGDQQVCERQTQPGFTHWGSFAEFVALDHADVNLVAVPEGMSFATAASLGCRFATAFRAVVAAGAGGAGRVGRGARLRRCRPVRRDDRGGLRRPGRRGRRVARSAGAGAEVRRGGVRGRGRHRRHGGGRTRTDRRRRPSVAGRARLAGHLRGLGERPAPPRPPRPGRPAALGRPARRPSRWPA